LPSTSQPLTDDQGILTMNQLHILTDKIEKIKKQASLEFIITTKPRTESEILRDNQVYLTIDSSTPKMVIIPGEKVKQEVGIDRIQRINTRFVEPLLKEKKHYEAIDKALNHITRRWIENYIEPRRENRETNIAITLSLVVFAAIILWISRAIKPLVEKQQQQYERMKREEQLSGKNKRWL
jgi:uncharacterized membrane protein YgcG